MTWQIQICRCWLEVVRCHVFPFRDEFLKCRRERPARASPLWDSCPMKRVYEHRRHLPHYQSTGKAVFLTFSTQHRWILPPAARTIALESCAWGDRARFNLHGAVVMPDHVHLVLTPLYEGSAYFSVAEIMQGIKSTSAHKINRLLNRGGLTECSGV